MVTDHALWLGLIALVAVERLVELVVSKRNAAWSLERGGVEYGFGHYPVMVVIHTGLLLGCVAEVLLADRPFLPALGLPMIVVAIGCQLLRWWCITTLGPRWNTRVFIVPGLPRVVDGPYRWMNHPNYVAVVTEGLALPLIHTAWITAATFTITNAALLAWRIRVEDQALATLPEAP